MSLDTDSSITKSKYLKDMKLKLKQAFNEKSFELN